MPVLRLDQAAEVRVGGKKASEVWIAGNRVWTPPPSASLLMLNATPAYLSFFTIQSATPSSIILNGQNTNRRVVTWAVDLRAGDVLSFKYQSEVALHSRTATDLPQTATRDTVLAGVTAASPQAFIMTLKYSAPYFGFLIGAGTPAGTVTITDFSITRPV